MKTAGGLTENNVIIGNTYDKYGTKNPIVRRLMAAFSNSVAEMVDRVNPTTAHEVGCGEGYWTLWLLDRGIRANGTDFSRHVIDMARDNAAARGVTRTVFSTCSIYDLNSAEHSANLVICCEVLEHLKEPHRALKSLQDLADPYIILSVPREPIWSILNMARGRYLLDFGNTPGHVQKWSTKNFVNLVSDYFNIEQIRKPLPWTIILASQKERVANQV
jgi:2-polyprenyl-3-methyl-5-hydroxy-6-metoxy-1,4-benzoquinol methylase